MPHPFTEKARCLRSKVTPPLPRYTLHPKHTCRPSPAPLHSTADIHSPPPQRSAAASGRSSTLIPTTAELTARTIAAGGDGQASTLGLMPRIHERLLREHSTRSTGDNSRGEGGDAASDPAGPGGVRERQTFMRGTGAGAGPGRGGLDLCYTVGRQGSGGRGRGDRGRGAAEWRLCDPRTTHCTQKGSHGSRFSCGYRNIQMLCSALLEYPEYKR